MISWIVLRGRCRSCRAQISPLYTLVEALYGAIVVILFYRIIVWSGVWELRDILFDLPTWAQVISSFGIHALFFGALLGATRTDLETMMIPQLFSLFLVPVGVAASFFGATEVTLWESILGAAVGYGILWSIAWVFKRYTGRDGIGEGDFELLAMIGSFLGPLGVWFSVLIGSLAGTLILLLCVL